jgi:hypothetical protein
MLIRCCGYADWYYSECRYAECHGALKESEALATDFVLKRSLFITDLDSLPAKNSNL